MRNLFLALLISLPCFAQQTTHKFADTTNVVLQGAAFTAMVADIVTTNKALKTPGTYEINPLAQSNGARIGLKAGGMVASVGLAYLLHRTGHHKAERIVPLIFAGVSGGAAIHNLTVR